MNPQALIPTALLLGFFVLLAGLYGLLYSIGLLRRNRALVQAGYFSYVLQCFVTLAILALTPLAPGWKLLVLASGLVYFAIPPITWRYLQRIHHSGSMVHDSQHH